MRTLKTLALATALALAGGAPHLVMATVTGTTTRNTYTGNGSTTVFSFTFRADDSTWVKVYLADVLQSSGYTVVRNANQTTSPGGTVTFSTAPAAPIAVRIQRESPKTQGSAFTPYSAFPSKTVESTLDKLALQIQEVDRDKSDVAASVSTEAAARSAGDAAETAARAAAVSAEESRAVAAEQAIVAAGVPVALAGNSMVTATGTSTTRPLGEWVRSGPMDASATSVTASGSSTPRPLAVRAADVVNILDYGAKADDGITDNGPLIETAAEVLRGRSGTLYIPSGNGKCFGIARELAIVGDGFSGLTITGDGPSSCIKMTTDTASSRTVRGIDVNGVLTVAGETPNGLKNVVIQNIRVSGFSITQAAYLRKLLTFTFTQGLTIQGVLFDTNRYEGAYSADTTSTGTVVIRNNRFYDIGGYGTVGGWNLAAINANTPDVIVEGNIVDRTAQFVEIDGANIVIQNNTFRNSIRSDGSPSTGMVLRLTYPNAANDVRTATVRGNVFSAAAECIYVDVWTSTHYQGASVRADATAQVVVAGNKAFRCNNGIHVYPDGTRRAVIAENYLLDAFNAAGTAIQLDGAGIITRNTVESNAQTWSNMVRADLTNGENVTISDNTFIGAPTTWVVDCGVYRHEIARNRIVGISATSSPRFRWGNVNIKPDNGFWPDGGDAILSPTVRSRITATAGALPAVGTWKAGDILEYNAPAAGNYMGQVCTVGGTLGTLTAITGSITAGTAALTVSSLGTIGVGSVITVAGVTGIFTVNAISGLILTLSGNANATVSGAAVQFSPPTFKTYGAVSP